MVRLITPSGAFVYVNRERITKVEFDHMLNGMGIYAYHIAGLKEPVLARNRPEELEEPSDG